MPNTDNRALPGWGRPQVCQKDSGKTCRPGRLTDSWGGFPRRADPRETRKSEEGKLQKGVPGRGAGI